MIQAEISQPRSRFDTLSAAKHLKAVGMTEDQADTIALVIDQSQASSTENLVTKADLNAGIATLRAEMKEEIGGLRSEMYKLVISSVGFLATLIVLAEFVFQ